VQDSPPFLRVPITGDGRCLFRAVARGIAFGKGMAEVGEVDERFAADQLRVMCVGELRKRRTEIEWALEADFETYVERMAQPGTWGGEPELLMLSHALGRPIRVFIPKAAGGGGGAGFGGMSAGAEATLVPADTVHGIATYNEDLGGDDDASVISVLFDGVGHYELLVQL